MVRVCTSIYSPMHTTTHMWLPRVKRFSQFGLNLKWNEMAKHAYSDYKIAMRKSGKNVSSQHNIFTN